MQLKDKVAIVTGSASGIGAGTARRMAEEGASVIVADINIQGAQAVAEEIKKSGGKATAFEVDISDETRVKAMMDFTIDTYGKIGIMNNNAGPVSLLATSDRDLLNLDGDVWDRAFAIQLKGTMFCCKHAMPHLIRGGGGAIINIASTAGKLGGHYLMTHQASKAGVLSLTRAIATRHGRDGVRCNAVLPGFIETPAYKDMPRITRQTIMRHTMSPRGGLPDDVAYLTIFLGSDRGAYINGVEIPVDGGYSCHEPATADFMEMTG